MSKKIKDIPIRIDFDTNTRKIIEIYEVSPDNSKVRTSNGWVFAYRDGVIVQRSKRGRSFMSDEQVNAAIIAEREMLKEKKYKHTAAYIVAQKYPIREWLKENKL